MSVVEIPLTQGKVALIDAEDAERVQTYKWHACRREPNWYAGTSAERRRGNNMIYLHRLVANAKRGEHVDHINGNGLDCRRENLRICTNAENRRNTRSRRGSSPFKGVSINRKNGQRVWHAAISVNDKTISLGSYYTEAEAARAYNAAAFQYYGEFACLNEIEGLTHEESIVPPVRNRKPGRPFRDATVCTSA
ncbi:MAG: HNH endonuclease [Pirellulaceae bacterium]